MAKIGIFYGSDTGNTEKVAGQIQELLGKEFADLYDISTSTREDIEKYDFLLFGIPTWYYGEAQCDWDDFFPTLKQMNLSKKRVAIFGCGDQEDYAEYFCDAIGEIYKIVKKDGAILCGVWPNTDYHFEESKALLNATTLAGLCIDEDRQPELTTPRIEAWLKIIQHDFALNA